MAAVAPPARADPPDPVTPANVVSRGSRSYDTLTAGDWLSIGIAKVVGDAASRRAALRGTASVGGRLAVERDLTVQGDLDVAGPIRVGGPISLRGSLRAASTLAAADVDLRGDARIGGRLEVQGGLRSRGSLKVGAGARCTAFDAEGLVEIEGELECGSLTAKLTGDGRVGAIRAQEIDVRVAGPPPLPLLDIVWPVAGSLATERIEGGTVRLEGTTVRYLRAERIVIGRHCHVAEALGEVVSVHPTSRVGFESRSPPPHGLHR